MANKRSKRENDRARLRSDGGENSVAVDRRSTKSQSGIGWGVFIAGLCLTFRLPVTAFTNSDAGRRFDDDQQRVCRAAYRCRFIETSL